MLVKINPFQAFTNMMDSETLDKVYVKRYGDYIRARHLLWQFGHLYGSDAVETADFTKSEFYLEMEEELCKCKKD